MVCWIQLMSKNYFYSPNQNIADYEDKEEVFW